MCKGLKEHAAVDAKHGFVLATPLTPASVNDTNFLAYCTAFSRHTNQKIKEVYADKGYAAEPNRDFLALNKLEDGIMRKDSTTAKLTDFEIQRNKAISKIRYIVEQYFGISHLHDRAKRARFITIIKNQLDGWFRQAAFNVARGMKILSKMTVWPQGSGLGAGSGQNPEIPRSSFEILGHANDCSAAILSQVLFKKFLRNSIITSETSFSNLSSIQRTVEVGIYRAKDPWIFSP